MAKIKNWMNVKITEVLTQQNDLTGSSLRSLLNKEYYVFLLDCNQKITFAVSG